MAEDFDLSEYDEGFDFGFTTVDESEVAEFEAQVQDKVAKATEHETGALESKLDKILKLRENDEQNSVRVEAHYKDLLKKVEKMVMPLLYNLMKNPENEYIKWPNRKEVIQKQINKIVTITRGA